jgi:hypothetical protein
VTTSHEESNRLSQNRAIEIHDSILASISILNGDAEFRLVPAYIHKSTGEPGVDSGTGWVQNIILRIRNANVCGAFSELPRDLEGGTLRIGSISFDNMIPMRASYSGEVELKLEALGESISAKGTELQIEFLDTPRYVEEFHSDMADH